MIYINDINEFKKVVDDLDNHIFYKNMYLKGILKHKKNNIIANKENLSIVISFGLIEDLKTILLLNSNSSQKRYIDYIIRGLVEQVIEYKYLIKNSNLIDEYFGSKINNEDGIKFDNPVKGLKNLGGNRYVKGRKKIGYMAKDIEEDKDTNEKLSLYSIFCICSEEMHNSYYKAFLDMIENKYDNTSLTKFQLTLINIIINTFIETYDNI